LASNSDQPSFGSKWWRLSPVWSMTMRVCMLAVLEREEVRCNNPAPTNWFAGADAFSV
jgi:hypothetical protein